MRGPYVFLLKGIKRLQIPRILRVSEDEQRRGQAVLHSFITPPLLKQQLSQLADRDNMLWVCTGRFVLRSHKPFYSYCELMSFLLVSVKVEFLRVPEIAQCLNVNDYKLAGRKSGA